MAAPDVKKNVSICYGCADVSIGGGDFMAMAVVIFPLADFLSLCIYILRRIYLSDPLPTKGRAISDTL